MARLLADENFPLPVVDELRRLGHEVLTLRDIGQAGQALSDEAVLAVARAQQRAILTLNRKHFIRLHATHPDHAGIVACTFDPDFVAQARRVDAALQVEPSLAGRLLRVNRPATADS
jgi:hypothetical protein